MKKKKVSIIYWVALAFIGFSLFTNGKQFLVDGNNDSQTFEEWSVDKLEKSWINLSEVKFNALDAVYIETENTLEEEVESRLFFIPMSSTGDNSNTQKIDLVLRVSEGVVYEFLESQLEDSQEDIQLKALKNPDQFLFNGPFTGGIQKNNKAMRKIQSRIPNLNENFMVFSPRDTSPMLIAMQIASAAFILLLSIIIFKLTRKSVS